MFLKLSIPDGNQIFDELVCHDALWNDLTVDNMFHSFNAHTG